MPVLLSGYFLKGDSEIEHRGSSSGDRSSVAVPTGLAAGLRWAPAEEGGTTDCVTVINNGRPSSARAKVLSAVT